MADLLFNDLRRRRQERRFRTGTQCEIDNFTDKELCAHYRFDESLFYLLPILLLVISVETLDQITRYLRSIKF